MDAKVAKPWVVRVVNGWLGILLACGLWQGYGAWLLGGNDAG